MLKQPLLAEGGDHTALALLKLPSNVGVDEGLGEHLESQPLIEGVGLTLRLNGQKCDIASMLA